MRRFLIAFVFLSILVLGQGVMARSVFPDGRLSLRPRSSSTPAATIPDPAGTPIESRSVFGAEAVVDARDPSLPSLLMLVAGLAGLKVAGDRRWVEVARGRALRRGPERP